MKKKTQHSSYKKLDTAQSRNFSIGFHRVDTQQKGNKEGRNYSSIDASQVRRFYQAPKRIAIIALIVIAVGFGVYYGYTHIFKRSTPEQPVSIANTPDTTPQATPAASPSQEPIDLTTQDRFLSLLEQNPDTIGEIKIAGTAIDYPVVQGEDNVYYIDHSFDKEPAKEGAIFLDHHCQIHDLGKQRHLVLYGHHMKDGSMFKPLIHYKSAEFFHTNYLIEFNTLYGDYTWEIFSVYVTPTTFNYIDTTFLSDASFLKFARTCQDKSMHENLIELKEDDVILTLSTCCYDFENARFVVQARLVRDEEDA